MGDLIFIIVSTNGLTQRVVLTQQQLISASNGTVYAILDAATEEVPVGLVLRRNGETLEVEVDGELIVEIESFYSAEIEATFSVDGSLNASRGPVVSNAPLVDGEEVVWSANDIEDIVTSSSSADVENLPLGVSDELPADGLRPDNAETSVDEALTPPSQTVTTSPVGTTSSSSSSSSAGSGMGTSTILMGAGGAALLGLALSGGGGGGGGSSNTALTVGISDNTAGTASGDVTYTFTFNKIVTGFTASDIIVSGGTKGVFTALSETRYTLVVTPQANSSTSITVDVAAGAAIDTPGNSNLAATQSVQVVDTEAPTVAVSLADTNLSFGETTTVTFTFSEAPAGFGLANVVADNAAISDLVVDASNPLVFTATLTPDAGIEAATNVVTVDALYSDSAGNLGVGASSAIYTVDTQGPTITIVDDAAGSATGEVIFTLTFSEDVTEFSVDDIIISGGAKGVFTAVSGTVYTLVVAPDINSTIPITVDVAAGVALDITGNGNVAAIQSVQPVDTVAPTLSSSTPLDDATEVALDSNIVLTFSEDIALGSGNIVISGGIETLTIDVTDTTQVSLANNVLTINPSADFSHGMATYNVQMAAGVVTDVAGNNFAGIADATTVNFVTTIDTSVIVFDLTSGVSSDHSGQTFQPGVAYTIYIKVNSGSEVISLGNDEVWAGAENLSSDDLIVLVGNGSEVKGFLGNDATKYNQQGSNRFQWRSDFPALSLVDNGRVDRFVSFRAGRLGDVTSEDGLWTGTWASFPNDGALFSQVYLTTLPSSVTLPT